MEFNRGLGIELSERSRGILAISGIEGQTEFVARYKNQAIEDKTCLVCMAAINKDVDGKDAISCLVVGAENGRIYILDSVGSSIVQQFKIPFSPVENILQKQLDAGLASTLRIPWRNSTK